MKLKIITYPALIDHNYYDVRWQNDAKILRGAGFISVNDKDRSINLLKCPLCNSDNYEHAIGMGICVMCGFNANQYNDNFITQQECSPPIKDIN